MIKEITPAGPIKAHIRVPGSKSITNRSLVCAALAKGESRILNASDCEDTALMANGLNQLGVLVRKQEDMMLVEGTGGRLFAPKFPIPVDNAGTTLRFLLALSSISQGKVMLQADDRMAERPIEELLNALQTLGVDARVQKGSALYEVTGGSLRGGRVQLCSNKTSQFLSSLLMVIPYASENVTVELDGKLASKPYIDTTIEVMRQFGVSVQSADRASYTVKAGLRYKPREFHVESDASGASYFLAAAAITGGEVFVDALRLQSLQGDAMFVRILEQMGCKFEERSDGISLQSNGTLAPVDIDMNTMPDTVPTLAVTALFAKGRSRLKNIAHLRYKESDRLEALVTELQKLGARITLSGDSLEIEPVPLHGAQLDTYNDHRLAMSFALVGLKIPGVRIEGPECVRKSFPTFWKEFAKLNQ